MLYFSLFTFDPFSMSFLYLLCQEFLVFFRRLASFSILFSVLKRTFYIAWKSHHRQLQVPIMAFNKEALLNISCIFNSKNPHHQTFWFLHRELLLMTLSKTVCGIALVLLWFRIIGQTKKTLGFHNNSHLLDVWSLDASSRCLFRKLPNI